MKTKVKRLSKRSLAVLLGVLMLVTSIGLGSLITVNGTASLTSDGSMYIYYDQAGFKDASGSSADWWPDFNYVCFRGSDVDDVFVAVDETDTNHCVVQVPNGTWNTIFLIRGNSGSWSGMYKNNQTYGISLDSTKNYLTSFQQKSSSATWGTYKPTTTASLTGGGTIADNSTLTLSPSIADTTYNTLKSTSYSVSPSGPTVNNSTGVFTPVEVDSNTEYTVTATVTYNAKGFAGITSTATATANVTVTPSKTKLATPTVSIAPNPVTAGGTSAILSITCADNDKVDHYDLYVDGTDSGTDITGTSYTIGNTYSLNGKEYSVVAVPKSDYSASKKNSNESARVALTVNKTTLTTPSISFDNASVTATPGQTVTLTDANYATIHGIDSSFTYEVYKDGTAAANKLTAGTDYTDNHNGTFTIDKKYSKSGTYYVKAVTSNSEVYSDSAASSGVALTVTRTLLAQPAILLNKTAAFNSDTGVTVTVTNYGALKAYCDFSFSGSTATLDTTTGVYTITAFAKEYYSPEAEGQNSITVTATLKTGMNEYYTVGGSDTSSTSAASNLQVYKPNYHLLGEVSKLVGGPAENDWYGTSSFNVDTEEGTPGVYSLEFTTKKGSDVYLGLYDDHQSIRRAFRLGDSTYYNEQDKDYTIPDEGVAASAHLRVEVIDSGGSLKFKANTTYTLIIDQTVGNDGNPKGELTITSTKYAYSAVAKAQPYNLVSDEYNGVTDASGAQGTVTPTALTLIPKTNTAPITAAAGSGYHFDGWYSDEACTTKIDGLTASASPTPTENTTYYALFKQDEPTRRTVTVASVDHATITATYNSIEHAEGTSFDVPDGAAISVTVTPEAGYRVDPSKLASGDQVITSNTTITCTPIKTYTVTYHKYGPQDPSTITINGSAATNGVAKTFDAGTVITAVTTVGSGTTFMGWFSDGDHLDEDHLYGINLTQQITDSLDRNIDVYGFFGFSKYYLGGYLRPSDYGNAIDFQKDDYNEGFAFSAPDASKPWLQTFSYDRVGEQRMIVVVNDDGTKKMYNTADNSSASDFASGALGNLTNYAYNTDNKWLESSFEYSEMTLTWNAITQRLSWELSSMTYDDKTVILVDPTYAKYEYMWSYTDTTTYNMGNGSPGALLSNFPDITIGENTYKLIIVNNSDIRGDNFAANVNAGDGAAQSADISLTKGKVNTIVWDGTNGYEITPDVTDIVAKNISLVDDATGKTAAATTNFSTQLAGAPVTITTHPDSAHVANVTVAGDTSGESVAVTQDGNSFKFTMPGENVTVTVTYPKKTLSTVTTRTNGSEYGSISYTSDPEIVTVDGVQKVEETATVTVTLTPTSACSYSSGTLRVYKSGDSSTTIATTPVTEGETYTFTMPGYDVIVYAAFEEYNEPANFWYDGYQRKSSGEAGVLVKQDAANSGTDGKWADIDNLQFNEVKYEGNKYAYLKVTRSDTDPLTSEKKQEFMIRTTADGSSESGGGGNYFYLAIENASDYWNTNVKAKIDNGSFEGMSTCTPSNTVTNGKYWKIYVPSGSTKIQVTSDDAHFTSGEWTLSKGGAMKIPDGASSMTAWDSGESDQYDGTGGSATGATWLGSSGTDYNLSKGYTYITGSQPKYGNNMALDFGFTNSNYPIHDEVVSPQSYYVIILYPDTDYGTLYPDTSSVGSNTKYRVFLSKILPGESDPTINYYAKDGVIRDSSHKGLSENATTTVSATDYVTAGTDNTAYDDSHYLKGTATKGHSITVTTTISDSATASDGTTLLKDKYYVAGFSFNGITPELLTPKENDDPTNGVYSCTYNIREDFKGSTLEITPIFFLKDSTNAVTFYIDGYNDDVQEDWGNTLYIYPFYQVLGSKYSGQAENYRAYPGQPVICYGALRYTQIPVTDIGEAIGTAGTARVKGVTINNGFWDTVHNTAMGWGGTGDSQKHYHKQTYDYDDFYKIYNEYKNKGDKKLNSIYYTFKYKEEPTYTKHRTSYGTSSLNSDDLDKYYKDDLADTIDPANYTDAEFLTDNYGRKVDLFGTVLSSSQISTNAGNELYVISQGYEYNNAGAYGTEWTVYHNDSGTYRKVTVAGGKTMIVPSALVIANADDVSDTDYPGLDGDKAVKDYKAIYEALEDYRGIPVKISYEVSLEGGAKPKKTYDQAFRADGRWTYTKTTDNITGNVKIEYINEKEGINDWTVDAFTTDTNVGSHTGVSAYFEYISAAKNGYGAGSDGATSITALVQDEKFFSMRAETSGSYEFQGWYSLDANGDYHPVNVANVTSKTAESAMARNATFVARFKYVASGSLTISHQLLAGNAGRGTTYIGVSVNGTVIADVASNTDSVTLDKTYIGSNKGANEITVTLKTVPSGENTFNAFSAKKIDDEAAPSSIADAATFFSGTNDPDSSYSIGQTVTRKITFTVADLYVSAVQKVMALSYYSQLDQPTNSYEITYQYAGRHGASSDMKAYTVTGTFTSSQLKAYITSGTGTSKVVDNQFYADMVPDESNFKKTITWNTDSPTSPTWTSVTGGYKLTATVTSTTTDDVSAHAVFSVPYAVDSAENARKAIVNGETSTVLKLAENGKTSFEVDTVYGKWFDPVTTCTSNTKLSESTKFVSAPAMIYEEYVEDKVTKYRPYYFSYWKVSSLTKTGKAGKFITNVYYADFYHISYENYYIEAIYSTNANQAASALATTNNGKNLDATISFLQDSRNQWNNDGHGDLTGVGGDIIWNDFAASFKYNGETLNDVAGDTKNIRTGFVFERVGKAEMSGDEHVGTLEGYEETYKSTVETSISAIETKLKENPNFTTLATNPGQAAYYASNKPFAANYEGSGAPNSLSDTTKIDNKNRCEYGYSMYNSYNASGSAYAVGTTYKNKTYVFRAFAYIMVKNGETWDVAVSAEPAYFCMYDTASKK